MSINISKQVEKLLEENSNITPEVIGKLLDVIYDRVKDIPGYKGCEGIPCSRCILSNRANNTRGTSKCVAFSHCMDSIRKERIKKGIE